MKKTVITMVLVLVAGVAVLMTIASVAVKSAADRQQIAVRTEQKHREIAEREVASLALKLRQTTDELTAANRRFLEINAQLSEFKRNSQAQARAAAETESEADKIARAIRSAAYEQSRAIQAANLRSINADAMRDARRHR